VSSLRHIKFILPLTPKKWYGIMALTSNVNIGKLWFASWLFITNCRGTVCCYDLTISACKEATGKAVTSNRLSTNSPACLRNIFPRIVHSPGIGMSSKHLVCKLAHPWIVLSANCVHKLSCPWIVCLQIGMTIKSPVTDEDVPFGFTLNCIMVSSSI